jgi:hypothetical protein
MSTKQEPTRRAPNEAEEEGSREATIRKNVIHDLGRPADLHHVQVRSLWERNYRVNVFVGVDATCAKVAHSFFLTTDAEGAVLASTPAITRVY